MCATSSAPKPDDKTIIFHMRDGKVWRNTLRTVCPMLRISPCTKTQWRSWCAPISNSSTLSRREMIAFWGFHRLRPSAERLATPPKVKKGVNRSNTQACRLSWSLSSHATRNRLRCHHSSNARRMCPSRRSYVVLSVLPSMSRRRCCPVRRSYRLTERGHPRSGEEGGEEASIGSAPSADRRTLRGVCGTRTAEYMRRQRREPRERLDET